MCVITVIIFYFLELLTIQSEEENAFVLDYSQQVWKGSVEVIVWLGMYYDSDSEWNCGTFLARFITN